MEYRTVTDVYISLVAHAKGAQKQNKTKPMPNTAPSPPPRRRLEINIFSTHIGPDKCSHRDINVGALPGHISTTEAYWHVSERRFHLRSEVRDNKVFGPPTAERGYIRAGPGKKPIICQPGTWLLLLRFSNRKHCCGNQRTQARNRAARQLLNLHLQPVLILILIVAFTKKGI